MISILRHNATSQRPQPLRHLPSYSTMMTTQKLLLSASSSTTTKAAHGWQRSLSVLPSMNTLIKPNNYSTNNNILSSTSRPESSRSLYSTPFHTSSFSPSIGSDVWNRKSSIDNQTTTKRYFSSQPPPGNLGNIFQHAQNGNNQNTKKPGQTLEQYGVDLTAIAKDGKLDPVIGRHEEIRRTLQILARRTKNNPVLVRENEWCSVY